MTSTTPAAGPADTSVGAVQALWRYPVKSMAGEELAASELGVRGLLGDRAFAIVDTSDGKVASAKSMRKFPRLLDFTAALTAEPIPGGPLPAVRISLPGGSTVSSADDDASGSLSTVLQRQVRLAGAQPPVGDPNPVVWSAQADDDPPDAPGSDARGAAADFELPGGMFFDSAVVHLVSTSTLSRLAELYPQGQPAVRRFRPNIVVETPAGGFAENAWVGRELSIGADVRLAVTGPCPRCVMVTLPQGGLPKDTGILRAAAQHNGANVGVYAEVTRGGLVRRGDLVRLST